MAQAAILITEEELDQRVKDQVERGLASIRHMLEKKAEADIYDSKEQTRTRLGVSMPTLDDAVKRGEINAYRFGGRVLFKRSEVDAALKQIKSDKFYNGKA